MSQRELFLRRIFISGETPGTGASTTTDYVKDALEIPKISGGKYFRALAHELAEVESDGGSYVRMFLQYKELLAKQQYSEIRARLAPRLKFVVEEHILARFQQQIESHLLPDGSISSMWDQIIDHLQVEDATATVDGSDGELKNPEFVLDSKLAVLLFMIDEVKSSVNVDPAIWSAPCLRVLLRVAPEVAAARATQRESKIVSASDILTRRERDFHRYSSYHIHGQPLESSNLQTVADVRINTELLTPPQVASVILREYLAKMVEQRKEFAELADATLPDFEPALAKLAAAHEVWQQTHQPQVAK